MSYQKPTARRIFESLIIDDGALITAVFSRQSGKSELVADVVVTAMIFLPKLAKVFPDWLEKFKDGLWVGAMAPVDKQAKTLLRPHRPAAYVKQYQEAADRPRH